MNSYKEKIKNIIFGTDTFYGRLFDISIADKVNEEQIKQAVRDTVASLPQSKLDQIINEELTKIIQERLNSSKIIISTENKKN